jgi:hypothetical protein
MRPAPSFEELRQRLDRGWSKPKVRRAARKLARRLGLEPPAWARVKHIENRKWV